MTDKNRDINQVAIYETEDGKIKVDVRFEHENLWLTQKLMASLFECSTDNISLHLRNIYNEKELDEAATTEDYSVVQIEGGREITRKVTHYSLEAIIAVGYRVNSARGTQFRTWATDKLKNYILKGFAIDSARFKYGNKFDTRYFEELLEEIREIRASERMVYQKITDIYATAVDYSPNTAEAEKFFATVQNKMHWAITGQTAAEIISERADKNKPHMGLTTWRKAPAGKILKPDVGVAKNYLQKNEIKELNHIVDMYLDYAELQASRGRLMKMKDWVEKLNAFLKFHEMDVLQDKGKVSREVALTLAEKEYEAFRIEQDKTYISDFDKAVKMLKGPNNKESKTGDGYNPEVELAKGADLTTASYDKTQKISVTAGKVTVGGKPGIAVIAGIATGKQDAGIDGTINLWLSIFRYKRPDGTTNHVAGWNISLALKSKQTSIETAKAFAAYINAGARPYKAKAAGNKTKAAVTIIFTKK
ncbi:MAG: hypothetical protein A2X28_07160 [Elusimicrobia bacterium GWA2_56_46]|nr:MAG: hypothetical protein A2X28_07160 [Elusimicrobia bacterium GWA2_56_46]OGR54776.1 MAG: hypothetical protein A2X39_10830 [Elusimicrobia bacterium GWC2_56_31]HBB67388.1 cell filamentation protein Fic [Elusimicrobiota bacterium]HBW23433.1 cell filamentation protein Fic [Elusimicrobiota bacterium]